MNANKIFSMQKTSTISLISFFMIIMMTCAFGQEPQRPEHGHGAVSIGIGSGSDAVTMPGNSPNIPPKPRKTFSTNSIVLNQILSNYDDYANFMQSLAALKAKGLVDYGEFSTAGNLAESFILITDKQQNIISVLDKGAEKRMNLLNNGFETLSQYADDGYSKTWFVVIEE